jgi:hypothetical protein
VARSNTSQFSNSGRPNPPKVWLRARKGFERILAPVERFLTIEAAGGNERACQEKHHPPTGPPGRERVFRGIGLQVSLHRFESSETGNDV